MAALVLSETIDSERPWRWAAALLPGVCSDSDSVGRWAARTVCGGGGSCEANDELRDTVGRVDECTGGSLRWRSPPFTKPCCLDAGERARPSAAATFAKVMVHSMSSPANTVESVQRTNTRMFDPVMVETGAARVAAVGAIGAAHRAPWSCDMAGPVVGLGTGGGCSGGGGRACGISGRDVNVLRHPRFWCGLVRMGLARGVARVVVVWVAGMHFKTRLCSHRH